MFVLEHIKFLWKGGTWSNTVLSVSDAGVCVLHTYSCALQLIKERIHLKESSRIYWTWTAFLLHMISCNLIAPLKVGIIEVIVVETPWNRLMTGAGVAGRWDLGGFWWWSLQNFVVGILGKFKSQEIALFEVKDYPWLCDQWSLLVGLRKLYVVSGIEHPWSVGCKARTSRPFNLPLFDKFI